MTEYEAHPLANLFPMVEGQDYDEMRADIAANGLREKIKLYQGKILDGRNRYRCCRETGVTPHFEPYRGDDPVGYVVSLNMRRRHLSVGQRAWIVSELANLGRGRPGENPPIGGISAERAASMMHVGVRSVERAREVREHGAPELVDAVKQGRVSIHAAAAVAELSPLEQAAVVQAGEREILRKASEIRARRNTERRNARIERINVIARGNEPLRTDIKYPIIYADPAWRYEAGDTDRSIENHYPTMSLEEICALPVRDLATSIALLLMWTTIPHLEMAFEVLKAWGFVYVSHLIWDKGVMGTGHWGRARHEILIIAKRGDFPAPLMGTQLPSLFAAPRGRHSEKPAMVAEWIEATWPTLPKIELNARVARPGWAVWGNESHNVAAGAA